MSNSKGKYALRIRLEEPGLRVLVVDAEGAIRGQSDEDELVVQLPKGLYTVRSELGGLFAEKVVRHAAAQSIEAEPPQQFSAAPLGSSETSNEHYAESSWTQSRLETRTPMTWNGPATGGLFVFLRAARKELYNGEDLAAELALRNLDGDVLTRFQSDEINTSEDGWAAFSARLSPAATILEYGGPTPRQMELPILAKWQTQLFLMHTGAGKREPTSAQGRLLFEGLRLVGVPLAKLNSHNNERTDEDLRLIREMDSGLLALQNDAGSIGSSLVSSFLNAKFRNPILGLLGAYLMLTRRGARKRAPGHDTLTTVIRNLDRLLPGSPDVVALRILAEPFLGANFEPPPVTTVPIFLAGTRAILDRAAEQPSIIPAGCLLDAVSERLLDDSAWTTWEPIALPVRVEEPMDIPHGEPNWVELAVADVIESGLRRGQPVTARRELAKQIGVSPRAVRNAFSNYAQRAAEEPLFRNLIGGLLGELRVELGLDSKPASERETRGKLTYNAVYAKLKDALSQVSSKSKLSIRASDNLRESLNMTSGAINDLEQRVVRYFVDQGYPLKTMDVKHIKTVRDLARALVGRIRK